MTSTETKDEAAPDETRQVSNAFVEEFDTVTMRSGYGWGKGIVHDVKSTIGKYWVKEMTNLNGKTFACSFFLYFACIAPAVTFGAVYGKATANNIGAVEMIMATAWVGITYALAGGQPMMINGGTGPVLAFTQVLYQMSLSLDVPFLTFNAWVGIWVGAYMLLAAVVDLGRVMAFCTRFTDEIFSFLIALIFIMNALGSPTSSVGVLHYFKADHPSHDVYEGEEDYSYYSTAFLSLIVFLGTTQLAFLLRKFKFSPFLPNQMLRNGMTDFAVVIAIFVMSAVGNAFSGVPLEKLNVPDTFQPTFQCCDASCTTGWPADCPNEAAPYGPRPWFVDLGAGPAWLPFMAAGPALIAFILVFLDDEITWHLINHPSHKLTHGEACNYDTILIGVMILVNSLFGMPWLVAATVRSLNHIHAMAEKTSSGVFQKVQETRLTGLFIHILCLVTIFALSVLKLIPVPVLYGVFFFMGLVSLGTNQFFGRIMMFFMQPSKFPLQPYTQYMKPKRMHLFTGIQLLFFAIMMTIQMVRVTSIAFPVMIALCIPFRVYVLPRFFSRDELILLDSDPNTIKVWVERNVRSEVTGDEESGMSKELGSSDGGMVDTETEEPGAKMKHSESMVFPAVQFEETNTALGPAMTPHIIPGKMKKGKFSDAEAMDHAVN